MNIRNKKAFTIVEMLIAIGLLVAMMAASVVVFRVAINAQQKASATGDYMRSIRSTSLQIQNDFSAIDLNAPFAIWFERNGSDRMYFFANGKFEQLSSGNLDPAQTVYNYGSLFYRTDGSTQLLRQFTPADRYQDIITPSVTASDERDLLKGLLDAVLLYDENNAATYGLLLNDQAAKFKVQILYGSEFGSVRWYPEDNPYPAASVAGDSDYDLMGDSFGVFFNIAAASQGLFYTPQDMDIRLIDGTGNLNAPVNFPVGYKPAALKFTITLDDPDGRLEAKTFTYIVRLIL